MCPSDDDPYLFCIEIPPRIGSEEDLNAILSHMMSIGASDVFILGSSEVWARVYSKMMRLTRRKISDKEAIGLISQIYGVNAQAKLGDRSPIDRSYEFKENTSNGEVLRHRFRVNAVGCTRAGRQSLTITMRSIPTTPPHADALGIEQEIRDAGDSYVQGLIIVVGSTGSGKSTLLASILREQLEAPDAHRNLVTIENPIEFVYDDIARPSSIVTQMEVGRHIESTGQGVINTLRMAPSVILVGESRDRETFSGSVEASNTGHVVFTTVHANDVSQAYQRIVAAFPDEMQSQVKSDLVSATNLIIAQRLLPTVDGKRVAVREFLILDRALKDKLRDAPSLPAAASAAIRDYGQPMSQDIERKYGEGMISKEVYDLAMINYNAPAQ